MTHTPRIALLLASSAILALGLGACSKPADNAAAVGASPASASASASAEPAATAGIAWRRATRDADIDAAFLEARTGAKPVFMYWGADWCPPCNQVKATLFNRQDFIERSRAFVPVYVDGDSPGAQKLGARFHVSGYPTMLLFDAAGIELTRLPGEVEPARYLEVMTLGMNAKRPMKAVLADALAGGKPLSAADWRLLAFYAWESDEQRLVPKGGLPTRLERLAAACPASEAHSATRLWLKALVARGEPAAGVQRGARNAAASSAASMPTPAERLMALLAQPAAARDHFDVLASSAADLVRAASRPKSADRERLLAASGVALRRFEADASLSRADRLGALEARVELARIDAPKGGPAPHGVAAQRPPLAPALLADVRAAAAIADRDITNGYERLAVIPSAAALLEEAGLAAESDALLIVNLAKSRSPYYLMTGLAENARRRGDTAAALRWHREAWEKSEGGATRLQWGARYLGALVALAPADEATIDGAATRLLDDAATQGDAFYERSARSLRRVSTRLHDWNRGGAHASVLRRFDAHLGSICGRLPAADPQRATCESLMKPEVGKEG